MHLGTSDDYAVLRAGKYDFYYGYEYTVPEVVDHEMFEEFEWAFVAWRDGEEVMRVTAEELGSPMTYWEDPSVTLLRGIGKFIEENW